jgi:hypothetical protein
LEYGATRNANDEGICGFFKRIRGKVWELALDMAINMAFCRCGIDR